VAVSASADTQAPQPCRLRRLIRAALWLSLARGVVAVLVVSALVVPLASFEWSMVAIFAAVAVGLNLGLWAGHDSGLASLAGAVLMPVVGLIMVLGTDVQTFGPSSGPIAPDEVRNFPHTARFRFTDARVATEFVGLADARRINGASASGAWRVAPIVSSSWTPVEPVTAWAVAFVSGYGPLDFRTPRSWQQSYRAAIRYIATPFSPAHKAIEHALARYDLTVAPGAPMLFWVEEPRVVTADERTFLAWVMFGGVATWLFFLVGETLLVPVPPDTERGPAQPALPREGRG
jgi:hypothetical protein